MNTNKSDPKLPPKKGEPLRLLLVIVLIVCIASLLLSMLTYVNQMRWASKDFFINDNGRIVESHAGSTRALEYAQALLSEEDTSVNELELARLYFLNAIQQDTARVDPLGAYVDFVLQQYPDNLNELNRAKTIVQSSLVQLKAEDIPIGVELLERITMQESSLLTSSQVAAPKAIDWAEALGGIIRIPIEDIALRPEELKVRLDDLYALYREATDFGESEIVRQIEIEIERTNNLHSLSMIAQRVEKYLNYVDQIDDKDSREVSARLLSASTLLSEFWVADTEQLPEILIVKLRALDGRLHEIQKDIQTSRIKALCASQSDKIDQAMVRLSEENKFQPRIEILTKAISEANVATRNYNRNQLDSDFVRKFQSAQRLIAAFQRNQYAAYQQWVVEKCDVVFTEWKEALSVSDKEAVALFEEHHLAEIDLSLLSPETHMVYSNIMQKISGELPGKKAFGIDKQVSLAGKKRLEDF